MPLQSNPLLHLLDETSRLQGRLGSLFTGFRAQSGLGRTEQLVLSAVLHATAPPTASQMGRSLGFPRQAIQRAANRLIEEGLICKVANPDHKRAPLLEATAEGRAWQGKADKLALSIANGFLHTTDAEKYHRAADQLKELRREIEAYLRNQDDAGGESR